MKFLSFLLTGAASATLVAARAECYGTEPGPGLEALQTIGTFAKEVLVKDNLCIPGGGLGSGTQYCITCGNAFIGLGNQASNSRCINNADFDEVLGQMPPDGNGCSAAFDDEYVGMLWSTPGWFQDGECAAGEFFC